MRKSLFVVFGFSLSACGVGAQLDAESAQFNQGGITVTAQCVAGVQTAASGCDTLADLEAAAAADCSGMQMSLGKSAASGQCVTSSGAAGFSQLDYACCPFNAGNNPANPNGPVPANPGANPANPGAPNACVDQFIDIAPMCETEADMKTKAEAICDSHQMQLSQISFTACAAGTASAMKFSCCPVAAQPPANPTSPTPANPNPGSICEMIKVAPVANPQNPSVASGTCGLIADIKVEAAQRCVAMGLPNMTVFNPISTPACMDPLAAGAEVTCCN